MSDAIIFRGLRAPARIGVFDKERAGTQFLLIDIVLERDLSKAGESDDVSDTVDYGAVTKDVVGYVGSVEVRLLEHLAESVAQRLLEHNGVVKVTVEIGKETPPIEEEIGSVSVRIVRQK